MTDAISRVAVVGAGTIGASWAALFLAKGLEVTIYDPLPGVRKSVLEYVENAWPVLIELGAAKGELAFDRLHFADTAAEAAAKADFVQESGPENPKLKTPLLVEIDKALPAERVIASSTSGLTIDTLRQGLAHPERMLVGHPFNPPHLIPLVEVVADGKSTRQALKTAMDFYHSLGKVPIHLSRSVPGHIANRLQAAVWREAIYLADQGIASIEDIDTAMATGPGVRWALLGPTATFHLGGGPQGIGAFVDKLGAAVESWWGDLGSFTKFTPKMKQELVDGVKSLPEWSRLRAGRDKKLVQILKLIAADKKLSQPAE
jgi:carnitine 3-dehydrogenase